MQLFIWKCGMLQQQKPKFSENYIEWRIFMLYYMLYTPENKVTSWFVWDWCMELPSIVQIPKRWTFGLYLQQWETIQLNNTANVNVW